MKKKAYVSPQVIRVKLEPSQAVLSQCSGVVTKLKDSMSGGECTGDHGGCKQLNGTGDQAATS